MVRPSRAKTPDSAEASASRGIEGPDFICIGLPKAATGWLYDQLMFHPDFWMPPLKEIGYLNKEIGSFEGARKKAKRLERGVTAKDAPRRNSRKDLLSRRTDVARDIEFFSIAAELDEKPTDIRRYKELFRPKREKLSGDVTPGYCRINDDAIREIGEGLQGTKILFLVRDPVARLCSELSMSARRGRFDAALLADPAALRTHLVRYVEVRGRVPRAAEIANRWQKVAPDLPFRHFMFDDIAHNPEGTLREIIAYIGGDPDKAAEELPPDYNRKASKAKLELTADALSVVVDVLRDDLKACAAVFGGHAREWAAKYGV